MKHPRCLDRFTFLTAASVASFGGLRRAASAVEPSRLKVAWGPFQGLSTDEMERLDLASRAEGAGSLLPSGVRVIDLVVGPGPEPAQGTRVYCHYKVWRDGFRAGPAVDLSFPDNRPTGWALGSPTDRVPKGVDEGVAGMREGGWRRLVVPSAYGAAGLRRMRSTSPKVPFAIKPYAPAYVDLLMFDGGSGRCDSLLRPPGVSERDALGIKSLTCSYKWEMY